jgi:hypothetical protein
MIRNLVVLLLLVFGAFFTTLYVAYDEFDPCRALAAEKARRAPLPTPIAKVWTSITTARHDRLSCTKSLLASWRQRLVD